MKLWIKIRSVLVDIEHLLDQKIFFLRKKLNLIDELEIYPYIGYSNSKMLYVKGRVLERQNTRGYDPDNVFQNIKLYFRRYLTNEIPGVEVKGILDGSEVYGKTDEEGFFELEFPVKSTLSCGEIKELEVELTDTFKKRHRPVKAKAEAIAVNEHAEFGVISDIDDTIIKSFAGSLWKSIKVMLLNDGKSRAPFQGIAGFYQVLQRGRSGNCKNPMFYVSGSSWNLYDLILKFKEEHNIPKGPLFLRDRGLTKHYSFSPGHFEYKPQNIAKIMNFYPHLSFLLIGDSGQKDAEIYKQIAQKHPERIMAVIIRNVSKPKRSREVHEIARELQEMGIPMCLTKNTDAAVEFSRSIGLIS